MEEIKQYLDLTKQLVENAPAMRKRLGEQLWNCNSIDDILKLETSKFQKCRNTSFWDKFKAKFTKNFSDEDSRKKMKALLEKFNTSLIEKLIEKTVKEEIERLVE